MSFESEHFPLDDMNDVMAAPFSQEQDQLDDIKWSSFTEDESTLVRAALVKATRLVRQQLTTEQAYLKGVADSRAAFAARQILHESLAGFDPNAELRTIAV